MDWPESNLGFWHFPRRHNKDFIRTPIICRPCPSSCAQSWWSPRATHWWGWWWGGDWLNRISLVVIWNSTLGGLTAQISGTWHSLSQPILFSGHDAYVPHYDDDVNDVGFEWQTHLCGQFPPGASHLSAPAPPPNSPTLQIITMSPTRELVSLFTSRNHWCQIPPACRPRQGCSAFPPQLNREKEEVGEDEGLRQVGFWNWLRTLWDPPCHEWKEWNFLENPNGCQCIAMLGESPFNHTKTH